MYACGEEIITTAEHPFYVPKRGWTEAIELRAGDVLVNVNGEYVILEKIEHELLESPVKVYNFEVEDFHTYYVGDSGVLVHNMCNTSKIGRQIGNAPRSNQAQNKQFDSIVKSLKLDKQQARMLHDIITGQGYSRDEIMEIATDLFGKRRWR